MTSSTRTLLLTLLVGISALQTIHAEDGLLWKTVNPASASVVPAYAGQAGPFPRVIKIEVTTHEDEAEAERQRQRDNAYNFAENLIKSGRGLQPEMRLLRVGGMLEGILGSRVLLNNQWVGIGAKVPVRLTKTSEVQEAIKALSIFDEAAASELGSRLDTELAARPLLDLAVRKITSSTLTLGAPGGKEYPVAISINR
jgi:hypothetical protein